MPRRQYLRSDSPAQRAVLALTLAAFVSLFSGCASNLHPAPGCGALRVEIKAQPKAGFRDAGGGAAYGDDGQPLVRPGYERVDYRNLGDIVVWLTPSEPASQPAAEPKAVTLKLSAALRADHPPVIATGRGGTLTVVNDTQSAEQVFSVTPPNHFNIAEIPAGMAASLTLREPGTLDLLVGSRETPVATVFVAPTRWVQGVRSGSAATFTDVPPGPCTVSAWHPRFPRSTSTVEVVMGESQTISLTVGVNALPKQ